MSLKVKDIRTKNDEDLVKELASSREELMNLRFQSATGALENSSRVGELKRTVARILTIINERETAAKATVTA